MQTSLDIIDNVADAITRLRFLEKKNSDDAEIIKLLTRQKDDLAQELSDAKHDFSTELYHMQQERDDALKKAAEVKMIIEAVGNMALSGVRKMIGDQEPQREVKPPLIVKHVNVPASIGSPTVEAERRPIFLDRPHPIDLDAQSTRLSNRWPR